MKKIFHFFIGADFQYYLAISIPKKSYFCDPKLKH